MDEYLFIEVAKLQADRRRVEREQREQQRRFEPDENRSNKRHSTPLSQWFTNVWSKQS